MDGYGLHFQLMDSPLCQSARLFRLAVTAGWQAGKWSAQRAGRSEWTAEDKAAAINGALAFLELNGSSGDCQGECPA